jgi:hypothetical protein
MDYKRLTVRKAAAPAYPKQVTAILKSREPDYLPDLVQLRKRISPLISTVELNGADVDKIRRDPAVQSLEIAAPMPPSKSP